MGQTEEVERERSEGGRESGGIGQVAAAMSLGNAAAYGFSLTSYPSHFTYPAPWHCVTQC